MYPQASWIAPELAKLTDDQAALENLGMFIIPNDDANTVAAYQPPTGMMLPSNGKKKELAKQVIFELTGPDAATAMYEAQPGIPFLPELTDMLLEFKKMHQQLLIQERSALCWAWSMITAMICRR